MKDHPCPRCHSTDVVDRAKLEQTVSSAMTHGMVIHTYDDPDALVFKHSHTSDVVARVCIACGFIELYAADPASLAVNRER